MVLWRPTRRSRTNTPKRCPFDYRGLECKRRKSRDTCSNRQIWPWSIEWSRAKAKRILPREHTGHLCNRMDSTPPGSSVSGILQARILEWVAMPSSRESSQPRDQTCISYVFCIGRWVLYHLRHQGSPIIPIFHKSSQISQILTSVTTYLQRWLLKSEATEVTARWQIKVTLLRITYECK